MRWCWRRAGMQGFPWRSRSRAGTALMCTKRLPSTWRPRGSRVPSLRGDQGGRGCPGDRGDSTWITWTSLTTLITSGLRHLEPGNVYVEIVIDSQPRLPLDVRDRAARKGVHLLTVDEEGHRVAADAHRQVVGRFAIAFGHFHRRVRRPV